MNGVRRFFAATNSTASSQPPSTTTEITLEHTIPPPKPPPLSTVFPLVVGSGRQPYPAAPEKSFSAQAALASPGITTAGLFLKKDGPSSPRRKPLNSPGAKTLPLRPTSDPPVSLSSIQSPIRGGTPPIMLTSSMSITDVRRPSQPSEAQKHKPSGPSLDADWKPASILINPRDDLLMSLLVSEAMVDSRTCEVLGAEEVEELKREQQLLSSRLVAMRKKIALESKIRDAAVNLQKLQTVKRLSKQTSEQVDSGNRKVDEAAKELSKLVDRASYVDHKLLEHRAAVLSLSVRSLESKISAADSSTDTVEDTFSASGNGITSQGLNSPTSSVTSISVRTKFDGPHLFAGHVDAIIPGPPRKAVNIAQIAAFEEKLRIAEEEVDEAKAREADSQKQITQLQLERSEMERALNLELQAAEETISKLRREMTEIPNLRQREEEWKRERRALMGERDTLARRTQELEQKLMNLQADSASALLAKNNEMQLLRGEWEKEKVQLNRSNQEEVERVRSESDDVATQQLNAGRDALHSVVRSYRVPTSPEDTSFPKLASSLGAHMATLTSRLGQLEREKGELDVLRRKYEEDVRNGFDIRERLGREIEEARREREEARKENRALEIRLKQQSERFTELSNVKISASAAAVPNKHSEEYIKLVSSLRSLWSILPSVEARASKVKNNTLTPASPGGSSSLSDMDVRTLKSLYDPKTSFTSPTPAGEFNLEEFLIRVHALIADDRALIARLIRFAQSHDLLRNNAERAQKLAQESNKGLEMYQSQVKALEERNAILSCEQLETLDRLSALQQRVEQTTQTKRDLEAQVSDQAEIMRNLQAANNKLSAGALAFAEEAAAAPNALKAKLEAQLSEVQMKLKDTEDEIERMRSSESTQRVALLDELNFLQQENGKLRDQLRAKK